MIYSNLIKKKKSSTSGLFQGFFSPPLNTNYIVCFLFKIGTIDMQVICVGAVPSGHSLLLLVIISLWQRCCSGQEAQSAPWCTSKHLAQWNSAYLSPAVRHRLIKMNVLLKCTTVSSPAWVPAPVFACVQHLCCCVAPQWTDLACWCWRCWRLWRSAACERRGAGATDPPAATADRRRALLCWCCSAGRLSPT